METWQVIVSSIGGSSILSLALVFLLRTWIGTRIRKSIEHEYEVKQIELKAQLDGKLEGVKAGYERVLAEHQIRFSRLHTDQAEAVKMLYKLVHRTHSRLAALVSPLKLVPDDPREQQEFEKKQHQEAPEAFNACNAFFQENRILLPEDVCDEMGRFLSLARNAYQDFGNRTTDLAKWKEADVAMQGPATSLKKKLEARFRLLLGLLPGTGEAAPEAGGTNG